MIKNTDTISRTHTSSCLITVKWGCVESGRYTHRSGLTLRILGNGTLQIHISISVETGFLSLVLSFHPVSFFQSLAFLMPYCILLFIFLIYWIMPIRQKNINEILTEQFTHNEKMSSFTHRHVIPKKHFKTFLLLWNTKGNILNNVVFALLNAVGDRSLQKALWNCNVR